MEQLGTLRELNSFQRDILYAAAGLKKPSGQDIKEELEPDIGKITHGRLYPNLDTLVEKGFIKKGQINSRSNYYKITDHALTQIQQRREWENKHAKISHTDIQEPQSIH